MANITKRIGKNGSVSYLIRVYSGEDSSGKQFMKSITYKPPSGMRPTTADKEAEKQAVLFENQVRSGLVAFSASTTFQQYANSWIADEPLAPKTRERYEDLLKRINAAIGHIPLAKLQARHLEEFYRNLTENGVNKKGTNATTDKLASLLKERKLSRSSVGKLSGCAASTVGIAVAGTPISIETAEKISTALNMKTEELFTIHQSDLPLSDRTINHHHRLICAILAKAKKERLVPFNVAQEHATAPKFRRKEANYMDDEEARRFLNCLEAESDIRVKTILMLTLFTGARRGEICGLSWPDVDFEEKVIKIRRASQYQRGVGVVEVPTKTTSSVRDIDVPQYVIDQLQQYRAWWTQQRLMWGRDWKGKLERLFVQEDGKPINPDTVDFWLKRFLSKNALPSITVHGLRHTFATLQITSGVDIRTLQARTGHAQASTLINTYSHAIKTAQEAASNAMASVLLKKQA